MVKRAFVVAACFLSIFALQPLRAGAVEAMPSSTGDKDLNGTGDTAEGEPTLEMCVAKVERAQKLALDLPHDDLSRYFAERHLLQAITEAGNGEFDDCIEWAQQAELEVLNHWHQLKPGEKLDIMRLDQ